MTFFGSSNGSACLQEPMGQKILVIANSRYPYGTANSVNVFRMLEAFFKKGLEVRFIAFRSSFANVRRHWEMSCRRYGADLPIRKRLLYWPLKRGAEPFLALVSFFTLLFTLRRNTLVYTRVRYVAAVSTILGFKTVFESHAPPSTRFQASLEKRFLRQDRSHLVLISDGLKSMYAQLGLKTERAVIAHDAGRLLGRLPPKKSDFSGPCLNLAYLGSLLPGRGIELLIQLAHTMPNRHFHIFGGLNQWKKEWSIPDNFILYDELSPKQAERIVSLFDALLMPYQQEVKIGNGLDTTAWMSPMKMFEYMLSGKPIISSELPALKEVLVHDENALLAPPNERQRWEDAIVALDNPNLRWKLAARAFDDASRLHTWDKRADAILSHVS